VDAEKAVVALNIVTVAVDNVVVTPVAIGDGVVVLAALELIVVVDNGVIISVVVGDGIVVMGVLD